MRFAVNCTVAIRGRKCQGGRVHDYALSNAEFLCGATLLALVTAVTSTSVLSTGQRESVAHGL